MSSGKGKNNSDKAKKIDNVKEAAEQKEKKQQNSAEEENIPVQSLSEMLAFAHEAEADLEEDVSAEKAKAEEKPTEKAKTEEKSAEKPKKEEKSPEKAKAEEKPAEKDKAEEKPTEKVKAEEKPIEKPKAKEKPAEKPKAEEKTIHRAPDGMPISAAEAARQAASEDALDRDLQAARKKKLKEEAQNKRQREEEAKKEAERIAQAEKVMERQRNAAEVAAQKAEAAKKAEEAAKEASAANPAPAQKTSAKKKNPVARYFNRQLLSMAAARYVAVVLVIAIVAYGGAFVYVNSQNEVFYSELETRLNNQSRLVSDESIPYELPLASQLNADEKLGKNLSLGVADTDKDGLTDYYELNISDTDPLNPDSDGDGLLDGREIRAELDPLNPSTDGSTPDNEIIRDATVSGRLATVEIKGMPKTAAASVTKLDNNSIQGTPGVVGEVYEFYTDKAFDSCEIKFSYKGVDTGSRQITESALSVFRFNPSTLTFEKRASAVNTENKTVTAQITESGIYALCDTSILDQKGETNIFFLIDNSGSMYPKELCAGSEENDVEFKRLDFATNLIDMLGVDANYGAGEFSGSYSIITPISNNYESVKQKISDIRNKNQTFSGTEIAGAILSAINEFGEIGGADKNYIILLTDGMPSVYNAEREQQAIEMASENNITIFTIGLGKYIDSQYLFNIAEETNGQFFQASNADALENIYEKLQNFMSYNQVIIEEESGKKGFIVADSGFNVLKDGIGYNNFRSDFAPNGADVGIAGLIRDYYTGNLSLTESGYTTDDGKEVTGYDISSIDLLADGKADLNSVEISALKAYNEYLTRMDKWNYRSIKGGVLHYTNDTRDFIDNAGLRVITSPYSFEVPEQSGFMSFLRTITFNNIKPFDQYECVLIDSKSCQGEDLSVMNMLEWYSGLAFSGSKCDIYDFGYDGDTAFDALIGELTTGSPAVITYGGSAMNAVRIARDSNDPDLFVIDAYDSNSPERSTRLTLTRSPVYDGENTPHYQYTASRGSVEAPLRIVISR